MKKLPEITLVFWIMKIAATTLGETGGDLTEIIEGLVIPVIPGRRPCRRRPATPWVIRAADGPPP